MTTPEPQSRLDFVLQLAGANVPWTLIEQAIDLCEQAGGLATTENNDPLPLVLLREHSSLMHSKDFVDYWARQGQELWRSGAKGDSALSWAMKYMHREERWGGAEAWIAHAPLGPLQELRLEDRNAIEKTPFMIALMRASVRKAAAQYGEPLEAVNVALARGIPYPLRAGKTSGGCLVSAPAHWDAFLKAGGDPRASIKTDDYDEPSDLAVWEWVKKRAPDKVRKHVTEWAAANAGDDLKKQGERDYWRALGQHSSATRQQLGELMRALPKWETLRDPQGRNPVMLAISKNETAFRELQAVKLKPLLGERDNEGRSLLFYALQEPRHVGPDMMKFVLAVDGVLSPSPVTGRGIIAQRALAAGTNSLSWPNWDVLCKAVAKSQAEDWWAMSPEDDQAFGKFFWESQWFEERPKPGYTSQSRGSNTGIMLRLAEKYGPGALTPAARGAVVLCAALKEGSHGYDSAAQAKLDFMEGATFPDFGALPPERIKVFEKAFAPGKLDALLVAIQERALDKAIAPAPAGSKIRI